MTHLSVDPNENRRDFLLLTTSAVGVAGLAGAVWPFIRSMSPSADVVAQATTEVDVAAIESGQMIVVPWQGKPVFVLHRTVKQIEDARTVNVADLPDPQSVKQR